MYGIWTIRSRIIGTIEFGLDAGNVSMVLNLSSTISISLWGEAGQGNNPQDCALMGELGGLFLASKGVLPKSGEPCRALVELPMT